MEAYKLSSRLQTLLKMTPGEVEVVWDICCDHGYYGRELLKAQGESHREQLTQVHLLDQVPDIIEKLKLETRLEQRHYSIQPMIHEADASLFNFPKSESCELYCIAGVGSNTIISILDHILTLNSSNALSSKYFLLGPHRHNFKLRQFLLQQNMGIQEEVMVMENGHFRELWLVNSQAPAATVCGSINAQPKELWIKYWQSQYQRVSQIESRGGKTEVSAEDLQKTLELMGAF